MAKTKMIEVPGIRYLAGRFKSSVSRAGRSVYADGFMIRVGVNGTMLTGSEVYGQMTKSEARKVRKAVRRAGFGRLAGEHRYGG